MAAGSKTYMGRLSPRRAQGSSLPAARHRFLALQADAHPVDSPRLQAKRGYDLLRATGAALAGTKQHAEEDPGLRTED